MATQSWHKASTLFEKADAEGQLAAEDLHQWALSLQCLGKHAAAIPVLTRAITARTKSGDLPGAVVDAIALADVYFDGGQVTIGKGWVARASDWASEVKDPATTSLVLWMKSKVAAFVVMDADPGEILQTASAQYANFANLLRRDAAQRKLDVSTSQLEDIPSPL